MYPKKLHGTKIDLVEITQSDAADIVRWRSDPRIYRQLFRAQPLTLTQHNEWFSTNYMNQPTRVDYMIFHRDTGRAAGVAGLKNLDGTPEVSYMIGEADLTGKGLAKDAIATLLCYAKAAGYKSVEAHIRNTNTASIHLVESLGFQRTREFEVEGHASCVYTVAL